jgi:hypothetical protein
MLVRRMLCQAFAAIQNFIPLARANQWQDGGYQLFSGLPSGLAFYPLRAQIFTSNFRCKYA